MLVTFETKRYPPITMLGDVAIRLLKFMGMSGDVPGAIKGSDVGKALQRLRSELSTIGTDPTGDHPEGSGELTGDADAEKPVSLTIRAFPLMELLSLASEQGHDVVWKVRSYEYQ